MFQVQDVLAALLFYLHVLSGHRRCWCNSKSVRATSKRPACVQAIGDTWNHVTNIQKNYGLSLLINWLFVLPSAILANAVYFQTAQTAGWVLFPMCVWLTVAAWLVRDIWRLNGRYPLLPRKG